MIKKLVWAIPVVVGGVAVAGTAIGLGYTNSQIANPYIEFFRRPAYNTIGGLTDAYMSAVTNGAKVVVGAGFTHTNPITTAVSQSFFDKNDTGFVLLDDPFNSTNQNGYKVASITFRISEAAFLTGIALGEYLNYYQDIFAPNENDRLTYASWGGMPFGTILMFMSGLQQGVNYFNNVLVPAINNNIQANGGKTYKKIHQITSQTSFAGGFAPENGRKPAEELMSGSGTKTWSIYEQGNVESGEYPEWQNKNEFKVVAINEVPDAVLVVAGPQVSVAVDEINKNIDKAKTVIIGVDVAQENDPSLNREYKTSLKSKDGTKVIEKPICFSIMKDLANITDGVLQNIRDGKSEPTKSGELGGLGWNSKGDLTNSGVSISDAGKPFLYNALVKAKILEGASLDPSNQFSDEAKLKEIYDKSVIAIKKQPDYVLNQGVKGSVPDDMNQYIPQMDIGENNLKPGLQVRNQYVAPYTEGNIGSTPTEIEKSSYFFEDNIVSQSNVKLGDEAKHKEFVKHVSTILNNDIQDSLNGDTKTFKNDIKVVLSESTSVLLDNSFSQSAFEGILRFLYNTDKKNLGYLYQDFRKNILHIPPLTINVNIGTNKQELLK